MKDFKVFGIGFHRTGTTTLQTCLEEFGYKVTGMREKDWKAYVQKDYREISDSIAMHDGFRDMPWPLMYRYLYENISNAKFILSYRDTESWLKSCSGNYKSSEYSMFRTIYGFDIFRGNENIAKEVYKKHIEDVRKFFLDKPGVFLEKDFTKDHSWEDLSKFLSEPIPRRDFPHANKRPKSFWSKVYHRIYRSVAPSSYKTWVRDKKKR